MHELWKDEKDVLAWVQLNHDVTHALMQVLLSGN